MDVTWKKGEKEKATKQMKFNYIFNLQLIMTIGDLIVVKDSFLGDLSSLTCCALDRFANTTAGLFFFGGGRCLTRHVGLGLVSTLRGIGIDLVRTVIADKICEIFNGAGAGVLDWVLILLVCGEKFDRWEALDLVGNVVRCSVNFSNGDELVKLVVVPV